MGTSSKWVGVTSPVYGAMVGRDDKHQSSYPTLCCSGTLQFTKHFKKIYVLRYNLHTLKFTFLSVQFGGFSYTNTFVLSKDQDGIR